VIDGTGLAEALLGLDGFKVLSVTEGEHELVIAVETTASVTGCWDCGVGTAAYKQNVRTASAWTYATSPASVALLASCGRSDAGAAEISSAP